MVLKFFKESNRIGNCPYFQLIYFESSSGKSSVYESAEGQYEEEVPTMDEEVPISEEYLAFMAETQRYGIVHTLIRTFDM